MTIANTFERARGHIDGENQKSLAGWLFSTMGSKRMIPPMKPDTPVTASKVHGFCPRYETLRAKYDIHDPDVIRPELSYIFDVGKMFHHMYRNWHMGPRGVYVGKWTCLCCNWDTDGHGCAEELDDGVPTHSYCPPGPHPSSRPLRLVPMPEECPMCGASRFAKGSTWSGRVVDSEDNLIVFDEWQLFNEEYGVRCKGDGWRRSIVTAEQLAQEVKSISPAGFAKVKGKGVKKEKPEHYTQMQIVLWLSNTKRGEIVYLCKAAWKQPDDFIHSVLVELDEPWLETHVWGPLKVLRAHLSADTLAPAVCAAKGTPRAKGCPLVKQCFAKENKPKDKDKN